MHDEKTTPEEWLSVHQGKGKASVFNKLYKTFV